MNSTHRIFLAALAVLAVVASFVFPLQSLKAESPQKRNLVLVLQKQKDPEKIKSSAEKLALELGALLGRKVDTVVPGGYEGSVEALISGQADAAYLSSLPFLLARRDGGARLILAERRPKPDGTSTTSYESVVVVSKDSPLTSLEDVQAKASSLRIAFTSATSTSGFVFPLAEMVRRGWIAPGEKAEKIFASVTYAGGYTQALSQVVQGRADLAFVSGYTLEGPTADTYLPKEDRDKLRILGRIDGVPTHLVAVNKNMSEEDANTLADALIRLSHEHVELLSEVYGAKELVKVDEDAHVAATVRAIEETKLPIEGLAK
jgi:phosphonate transport system substrate-binding protein